MESGDSWLSLLDKILSSRGKKSKPRKKDWKRDCSKGCSKDCKGDYKKDDKKDGPKVCKKQLLL